MATTNRNNAPDSRAAKAEIASGRPAAAFPQGQAAFPNNSTPGPEDASGWSIKKILDEFSGPKPAY
jgi:hypothetical protein